MALATGACYGQPLLIEAAAVERTPFGLFSVAEMITPEDPHWQQGVEWEPAVCGAAAIYNCPTCNQNNGNTAPAKSYAAGPGSDFASPFTVYGSFNCSPIGNWDRAEARAKELLANGEERAVESAIALSTTHAGRALQAATSLDITPTPGTPVTILQGIALLESYIGANSSGQGVIVANKREATLAVAQRAVVRPEAGQTQLFTNVGTPVAAVGGWNGRTGPNNVAAVSPNSWIFVLGSRPRVWRSEVFVTSEREESLKTTTNDLKIAAERTYIVGWDCFTAAVLVSSI